MSRQSWELVQPGLQRGTRKTCMLPCHSCQIYGIWRSNEVGDVLESFAIARQATNGAVAFIGKKVLTM